MRFSEAWLREWVNLPLSGREIGEQLTMAGLEMDSIEPAGADFQGVVVAHVQAVEPHPDAARLRICQVDAGEAEKLQVVCGAANVRVGMRAPLARVGAILPGGKPLEAVELRGVRSQGMLCSAAELGLADQSDGLMSLSPDTVVGEDLRTSLGLDDQVIDIDLTPNRGDCLSIAGIARECGVLNRLDLRPPQIASVVPGCDERLRVVVQATEACPRYVGRIIRAVSPGAETPLWMVERLRRSGIRSLGPLVDVTNYVMLELGQPMHAFDLRRLQGGIVVRMAEPGEQLRLLDGRDLDLDEQTLVIADHEQVLALAGIMGGEASGCTDDTVDIFLESAFFSPRAILGRARGYGMHTESSHRFERGVDPGLQVRAMERATTLLLEICGGRPGPVVDVVSPTHLPTRKTVGLRAARLEQLLGVKLPGSQVQDILERLGMGVEASSQGWQVTPPTFRFDIALEADLIEEVGRIHGYDRLPSREPLLRQVMEPQRESEQAVPRLQERLIERGYHEVITYSFVDPRLQAQLDPGAGVLELANPISSEMSVMRTSLWPGLVRTLQHNLARQQDRVRIFETGLVFRLDEDGLLQRQQIGGLVSGSALPEQWGSASRGVDFFDLKGDVLSLRGGQAAGWDFVAATHPALHPGQSARIEESGRLLGWIGALHPALARSLDLTGGALVFELDLQAIRQGGLPAFRALSRYPSIRRDLALLVADGVSARAVLDCVRRYGGELLQDLVLFDLYQGEGVEPGFKSVAIGLILQAESRTLTDAECDAWVAGVVSRLQADLGAKLRK